MAKRDKKAFLSEQCKETKENNRMGKISDLFKKIRNIKGTFHARIGMIKDRNGKDLTEAEGIKKMWQEYTEELYKKDLHDPDYHNGVITHLEPEILECEIKWALLDPVDCSPPGSSVRGILQARILKWVAMPSSRGSSRPRDQTHVFHVSCTGGQVLYH